MSHASVKTNFRLVGRDTSTFGICLQVHGILDGREIASRILDDKEVAGPMELHLLCDEHTRAGVCKATVAIWKR